MRKKHVQRRLLPAPWLSLGLFFGWLLLQRSAGAGAVLLGLVVALAVPPLVASLRPRAGRLHRWRLIPGLILRVGRDAVVAALQVAAGALRPKPPRSRFVTVPLQLRDVHALAALSMITAAVPGTVWCELAADGSSVLLHLFDVDDEAAFVAQFKRDYEQPLREIFE